MINPLRGVLLNGRFYNYISESYRETLELRNTSTQAQNNRVFSSIAGATLETFAVQLQLDSKYEVRTGLTIFGVTNNLGVTRLLDLKSYIGNRGVSMPITFVSPYGASFSVVPTGAIDIEIFNPSNPEEDSVEFRVSLTLERSLDE